jgi:hypothetical protein
MFFSIGFVPKSKAFGSLFTLPLCSLSPFHGEGFTLKGTGGEVFKMSTSLSP